ncbi:hypothetical protein KUTeg_004794 [Tegillarca granosa]|uniref:KIND domain-containing protein n=1 Tax=Tegillarca granosa TaxID=220873 RepID=A0ABQ9FMH2_TEGGR|nr:hypothetical protein KUTeg_004794 [Tegillarca granosa]
MEDVEYEDGTDSLPALNEGDEAVSLSDILAARDSSLVEEELWALCRECCLVLEVVNNSPDMFQTLCITPDTVAFDSAGNVCFLDLDADPEPLYIPPEYDNVGNTYKSHLFSLGMTLLYAAEYNGEPGRPEISEELRQLFGCMTSENLSTRPNLESVITQCEEELCGKSSQEVCCAIGTFLPPYTPAPDHRFHKFRDPNQPSPSNQFPQQQSTPNHQFDSPPPYFSSPLTSPLHLGEAEEDMPARNVLTGPPQPTGNRGPGLSPYTKKPSPRTSQNTQKQNKPPLPKKPERISQSFQNDSGVVTDNFVNSELESPDKIQSRLSNFGGNNNENINGYYNGEGHVKAELGSKTYTIADAESFINQQKRKELTPSTADNSMTEEKPKQAKRRRGMTIGEVLDAVDRYLTEEELWALCREGTLALQRKKKHLPAYLSPDTLVLRENGNLSFKAIPEDKPLETCLYGLGITLRCGGGKKYGSVSSMSVSKDLQDLVEWMTESENNKRPNIENVIEVCNKHQEKIGVTSFTCCQNLFQEAHVKMGNEMTQSEPQPSVAMETNSAQGSNAQQTSSAFKPVKGSWVKPTTGSRPTSGAFQPVDKAKSEKPKSSLPQAYLSAATHFKPIVLQQASTPPVTEQIDKQPKDSQPNEKDKEVVKKLKELKKNLMKHRQPAPTTKEDESPKYSQQMEQDNQGAPSNWQKPQPSGEVAGKEEILKPEAGTLELLLSEIKKQGSVPDMESLAASIAQHLQNQLNQFNVTGHNPPSVDTAQGQGFNQFGYQSSGQTSQNPVVPGMLPNLNIPPQYQQHLVGQTMTLPMQYGGAALYPSGFPGQVQLQQDPRTGYIQLVPVNFMQIPAGSGTSQVVEHNINDDVGQGIQYNGVMRSRSLHALDRDDNLEHFYSDGEVIKTSSHNNMALKPGLVYDDSVLHLNRGQLIQNNAISSFDRDQTGGRGTSEREAGNSGGRYFIQPPKTRSQSSSPSPSKDSGVSGMNMGGVRPPAPGSLMDRLLSNFNLTQQQKLGRVVHLLREEFAFDGYMENGVEDLAMGNLKWETFVGAITEKYSDLYWATELLANLFDAVNGGQRSGFIDGNQLTDIASLSKSGVRPRSHLATRQQESDSTDNENYERRRRYKKKHNMEKPRSSSMHNLATETGQFTVYQTDGAELSDSNTRSKVNRRLSDHIDNMEIRQFKSSENENYNQSENNDDSEKIEMNNNTSLLNERLGDISQNTSTATAPSTSHSEQLQGDNSDPPSSKSSTHHNSFNKNDLIKRNETMTRTSSLSSHSSNRSEKQDITGQLHRHLSRLSLTENVKEEMAAQKRKGQVVYHWAMIDLCMTKEVEKFRQDIMNEVQLSFEV